MKKGTLNWYCPLWNLTKEFSGTMSILTASLSMQIFEVLVPGCFTVESLEAVQTEVPSSRTITIAARKLLTRVLDRGIMPLPVLSFEEQIGHSPLVTKLGLSENAELHFSPSYHQDVHRHVVVPFEDIDLIERKGES